VTESSGPRPVLEVRDLRVWLSGPAGPLEVVEHVDLDLLPGDVLGIAGESGSGKTVTALALMGLLPSGGRATGSVRLGERELLTLSASEWNGIRGAEIGMVFQDPMTSLHPMLSVGVQIGEHFVEHGLGTRRAARARALELLERVRIPSPVAAFDSYPHQLSGGMRQRVAIAVALACRPKVLIADEPTTALDVTVQAGILHLLRELCSEDGMAMILVTHDLGVMSAVADRLAVFYAGRVVEQGPCRELLGAPRHPYTRGLLDALPGDSGGADDAGFAAIPGAPPQPGARPAGCAFGPRCAFVKVGCRTSRPPLSRIDAGRIVACPVDPFHDMGGM
jgi:oligopeptide transport system ATP-binding protein